MGPRHPPKQVEFVNDDGSAETADLLRDAFERQPSQVTYLSRNSGTTSHSAAASTAPRRCGMINVDMEDAPDQIPLLLNALKTGARHRRRPA